MPIVFFVEETEAGLSAYSEDFPIAATAATEDELKKNIMGALNSYCKKSGEKKVTENEIYLRYDD